MQVYRLSDGREIPLGGGLQVGLTPDGVEYLDVAGPGGGSTALHAATHGSGGADQIAISAAQVTSGILVVARGGTGVATAAANRVFAGPSSGADAAPTLRALVADDIPSIPASKIASGNLDWARMPTPGGTWDVADGLVDILGSLRVNRTISGAALRTKITTQAQDSLRIQSNGEIRVSDGTVAPTMVAFKYYDTSTVGSEAGFWRTKALLNTEVSAGSERAAAYMDNPSDTAGSGCKITFRSGASSGREDAQIGVASVSSTAGKMVLRGRAASALVDRLSLLEAENVCHQRLAIGAAGSWGSGAGLARFIGHTTTAPTTNPSGGSIEYHTSAGGGYVRLPSGRVINFAPEVVTTFVQSYATADPTHAARTWQAITDGTGGSAGTTIGAFPTLSDSPASADALRDDIQANLIPFLEDAFASLITQLNNGRTDQLDTAQFANSLADQIQSHGYAG